MEAGKLGVLPALVVPDDAPSVVSLGQLVMDEGASFQWRADDPDRPSLTTRTGDTIPLVVRDRVPMLAAPAAMQREEAALAALKMCCPASFTESSFAAVGEAVADAGPGDVRAADFPGNVALDVVPAAAPDALAGITGAGPPDGDHEPAVGDEVYEDLVQVAPGIGHNLFTHRPADPASCPTCRAAKLDLAPARRVHNPRRATEFGERVHVDTIGPLDAGRDGSRFVLVARDEATGWAAAVPLPTKESRGIARAYDAAFGFGRTREIRSDPGREFEGYFKQCADQAHVILDVSVPHRPQTHARAERYHRELENATRCALHESGLPHEFWPDALVTQNEHLNRVGDIRARSPHEARFGRGSDLILVPFGAAVRFRDDALTKGQKLAPRSKIGIMIGYHTARAIKVLELLPYVTDSVVTVVRTRDYRIVPGDAADYQFPYAALASALRPAAPWSFARALPEARADEHGHVPICIACARPKFTDDLPVCPACSWARARHRIRDKARLEHTRDGQCDDTRCKCAETIGAMVPEVTFEEAPGEVIPLLDDIVDFSGMASAAPVATAPVPVPSGSTRAPLPAAVTRIVPATSGEASSSPAAQEAIRASVQLLHDNGVIDLPDTVAEWRDVARQDPSARVVRGHIVLGIKHSETGEGAAPQWKGRLVAAGNNVRDSQGCQVADVLDASAPASLDAIRAVIACGLRVPDGAIFQVDIEAAYLHAELTGPAYYLELPRVAWPQSWCTDPQRHRPVLRLRRALPGLQQSGELWHDLADRAVRHHGWEPITDAVDDIYVKRGSASLPPSLLALYVDDWLFCGPAHSIPNEIAALSRSTSREEEYTFHLGAVGPLDRFLGTYYAVRPAAAGLTTVEIQQHAYAKALVERYLACAGKTHLRKSVTPVSKEGPHPEDYDVPGSMADHAPQLIGALLWLARCSRPDLAYAVSLIARFSASWTRAADKLLDKVFAYLAGTVGDSLYMWVAPGEPLHIVSFVDADHGSCPLSSRSTSGLVTFLASASGGAAPVSWASRRQTCSAASTGEAEVVAFNDGMRKHILPMAVLIDQAFDCEAPIVVASDSTVAITAVEKGVTPGLKYMRKNQRISISALADSVRSTRTQVVKVDTEINVADFFTKPMVADRFLFLKRLMGMRAAGEAPGEPPLPVATVLAEGSRQRATSDARDATRESEDSWDQPTLLQDPLGTTAGPPGFT